jgi:8-oxo-dGTP pyrophosphatase MutT (NUDIX family)
VADAPPGPTGGAAATPAATVVPLRDGQDGLEVLLLRRSARGVFAGMWVFPGGHVDPEDRDGGDATGVENEMRAARRAAVREAHEEAGLELAEADLVTLSFWLPPLEAPRRFATWFFLAPAAEDPEVVVDADEIHDHLWEAPAAAMASRNAGRIELVPPTFTTLWWLAQHRTVASALEAARARSPERFATRMAASPDGRAVAALWAGDSGYGDGNPDRPGARRRLWLDAAGWRVEIST